jgi:acetyl esterase/lipase
LLAVLFDFREKGGSRMDRSRIHPDFRPLQHITLPVQPAMLAAANRFLRFQGAALKPLPHTTITERKVLGKDGNLIPIQIFEPEHTTEKLPCLLYFHGGAFVIPAALYHRKLANQYAQKGHCRVVFVDYRLTPRHPFPAGLEDCYSALQWVYHQAETLHIDRSSIGVAGDSAGGNLAACTALLARDRGEIPLCLQMLIYPVTDRRMITKSMAEFHDTPMWNSVQNEKMWQLYLQETPAEPDYYSPIEAKSLAHLPTTYLEVAELDCLRDEGLAYGRALQNSGSSVTMHKIPGAIHGFDMMLESTIVRSCVAERVRFLKEGFQQP